MLRTHQRSTRVRTTKMKIRDMRAADIGHDGSEDDEVGAFVRRRVHDIRKSLALFACAALPVLAWATPQGLTVDGPHSASPAKPVQSAGRKTFDQWCSDCHRTAEGPGSLALQRKYRGALPAILEERGNLPPEYVKFVVRHGISFMPSFRKTEISDADLALLAAYLANPQ